MLVPRRLPGRAHRRVAVPVPAALTVRVDPRWGLRPRRVDALCTWGRAWTAIDTPDLHAAIARHLTFDAASEPACGSPDWAHLSDEDRRNLPASPIGALADLVEREWPDETVAAALHHY